MKIRCLFVSMFVMLLCRTVFADDLPWKFAEPEMQIGSIPDPGGYGDERKAAWCLDAWAARDFPLFRRIWARHGGRMSALMNPIDSTNANSWNIPVLASTCAYLAKQPGAGVILAEYLRRETDPTYPAYHGGFMGREQLSSLYWWPAPALGLVHVEARRRDDLALAGAAARWLRAYTYALSLIAVPQPSYGLPAAVFAAGARTPLAWAGNPQIAFWHLRSIARRVKLPRGWELAHETWGARVADAILPAGKAAPWVGDEAPRLRNQLNSGSQAGWVLSELQEMGFRLLVPFRVIRYPEHQLVTLMDGNAHPSTPPLSGTVLAGRHWSLCSLWPDGFRGEGRRRIGAVRAWLDLKLRCSTTGALWGPHRPRGRRVGLDTWQMDLDIPSGGALYDISIDQAGSRFTVDRAWSLVGPPELGR